MLAVIRYQDERTVDRCKQAVVKQFGEARIVRASPFFKAVKECFKVALESDQDWLVTVDADVIIADDYRDKLEQAIANDQNSYTIMGDMDCNLSGTIRQGGVRAWRVSALGRYEVRNVKRPESDLCHRYGNWRYIKGWVTGRHGYDQWLSYYYRAGQNSKWQSKKEWHKRWKASGDADLTAAWRGLKGQPLNMDEKSAL
jgi:hypothetical protein